MQIGDNSEQQLVKKEPPKKEQDKSMELGQDQNKQGINEQDKIKSTAERINEIDEMIFKREMLAGQDRNKIGAVQKQLGITSNNEVLPIDNFNDEEISKFEVEREKLTEQYNNWQKKFGEDNLPDGLAVAKDENDFEAKGAALLPEEKSELNVEDKVEQIRKRKEWLESWKKEATANFEKALRNNWRTKNAANLDLTIELMKLRVPNAMEKEMKDYVEGKTDEPCSIVWMHWESSSLLDRIIGKPNMIKKLNITFDKKSVEIAGKEDLEKADEDNKELKSVEKPKIPKKEIMPGSEGENKSEGQQI